MRAQPRPAALVGLEDAPDPDEQGEEDDDLEPPLDLADASPPTPLTTPPKGAAPAALTRRSGTMAGHLTKIKDWISGLN